MLYVMEALKKSEKANVKNTVGNRKIYVYRRKKEAQPKILWLLLQNRIALLYEINKANRSFIDAAAWTTAVCVLDKLSINRNFYTHTNGRSTF